MLVLDKWISITIRWIRIQSICRHRFWLKKLVNWLQMNEQLRCKDEIGLYMREVVCLRGSVINGEGGG